MREQINSPLPFAPDIPALTRLLHAEEGDYIHARARELLEAAARIVKPRYMLKELPVGRSEAGLLLVNNVLIDSRIVAQRVGSQPTLFAYICSCGPEIAAYMENVTDLLDNYILDQIAYLGYFQAKQAFLGYVEQELGIQRFNLLSPGSVVDWSVAEVKKIFQLLGDMPGRLGIRVMASGLVSPLKSVSGFLVANDEDFCSCELCERAACPSREKDFDEDRYQLMINL